MEDHQRVALLDDADLQCPAGAVVAEVHEHVWLATADQSKHHSRIVDDIERSLSANPVPAG